MAKTNLGRVAMHPAGVWNAFTQYNRLDLVEDNEGSYMAILDNVNTPTTNTSVWQKVAGRGPAGTGNVTAFSEETLVSGESYVFRPSQDGQAMGEFIPFTTASQQQSDWEQEDNSKADYIKNKPVIPEVQIQSDWDQENNESKDFIRNKPEFKTIFSQTVLGTGNIEPESVKDIQYSGETAVFTISYYGGRPDETIHMPADNFLSNAEYDPSTHVLTLTMSNGEDVPVPLEDLISEYKVSSEGGLELVNGNEFKIADPLLEIINRTPKHKAVTVEASAWTQTGTYWQAVITDADILDDSVIDLGSDESTYSIYKKAAFLPVTTSLTAGSFAIMAENKPTDSINLLYSITL